MSMEPLVATECSATIIGKFYSKILITNDFRWFSSHFCFFGWWSSLPSGIILLSLCFGKILNIPRDYNDRSDSITLRVALAVRIRYTDDKLIYKQHSKKYMLDDDCCRWWWWVVWIGFMCVIVVEGFKLITSLQVRLSE